MTDEQRPQRGSRRCPLLVAAMMQKHSDHYDESVACMGTGCEWYSDWHAMCNLRLVEDLVKAAEETIR